MMRYPNLMKYFVILFLLFVTSLNSEEVSAKQAAFFETKIRPVLSEYCYKCHSNQSKKLKGDLFVDSRAGLVHGGELGPAIDLEHPEKSNLLIAMSYEDPDMEMPPKKKLSKTVLNDFRKWLEMGAPWPGGGAKFKAVGKFPFEERKNNHWAWQDIAITNAPEGKEIDHFVEQKRKEHGLQKSNSTDKLTLIKRLSYDLIGLPPTLTEIETYLNDKSPGHTERLVDRLLEQPHFGEKWARHWMDSVRYAESYGHEFDFSIHNPHPYRDYLIRAFNQDVPYDQFVKEHIAGDLIPKPRRDQNGMNESIIGTAFYQFGEMVHAPTDVSKDEADRIDNQIDVLTKTFLGMTVSCARCHDHKFDPIRAADYYALSSFLQSTRMGQAHLDPTGQIKQKISELNSLKQEIKNYEPTLPNGSFISSHLKAVKKVINLQKKLRHEESPLIFDDFENGLSKWTVTGNAFHISDKALDLKRKHHSSEHGKSNLIQGKHYLSSYNGNFGHHGKVKSKPFTIERKYLIFHHAGGAQNWKGFNANTQLIVNGKKVLSNKFTKSSTFQPVIWNVNKYKGQKAVIEIIDRPTKSHGGAINIDKIYQTDYQLDFQITKEAIDKIAQQENLSSLKLNQWIRALSTKSPLISGVRKYLPELKVDRAFKDVHIFHQGDINSQEWFRNGFAFKDQEISKHDLAISQHSITPLQENIISSRRLSNNLIGTVTGPEFVMTEKGIDLWIRGQQAKVRVIIENYQMQPRSGLLFGGSSISIDHSEYKKISIKLDNYIGKTCYLEVSHQKGGYFDILSFNKENPNYEELSYFTGDLTKSFDDYATSIEKSWNKSLHSMEEKRAKILRDWATEHLLYPEPKSEALLKKYTEVSKSIPNPTQVIASLDGTAHTTFIHNRGSYRLKGADTPRRFFEVFGTPSPKKFIQPGSGRLLLANAIAHENPLVSRVMVNRIWHHLFGKGIVPTCDDFGAMGQKPSHLKLLDWLANDFKKNSWSIKTLIKKIVLSETYQQSSKPTNPQNELKDPNNTFLHRMNVRRKTAEQLRDSILAVTGKLNKQMYGASIPVHITPFMKGRGTPSKKGPIDGEGRRSLYLSVTRNFLSPFLLNYDFPAPFNSMGRRSVSNVPSQALTLMNDPFVLNMVEHWGKELTKSDMSDHDIIQHMFLKALIQTPNANQIRMAQDYLKHHQRDQALNQLAHVILNMKSFMYVN